MSECHLCGAEMRPWLRQRLDPKKNLASPYDDFRYCDACDIGAMASMPQPSEVRGFYDLDQYYTQGESHIKDVPARLHDKILTKLAYWADFGRPYSVDKFRGKLPADAVAMDIGSGGGELLRDYAAAGWRAVGVEPDPSAQSHDHDGADITVHVGAAEDLPEPVRAERFDLISMTHVLEHCVNPRAALENIACLLKEGGYFWCEVPNCGCVHFEEINVCSEMFDAPRHIYFFTEKSLRAIVEKAGFEIVETYYHGFTRHHNPAWRAWEQTISRNARRLDPNGAFPDHSFAKSLGMLAKSAAASPVRKYDCVGVIARKRPPTG